MKKPAYEILEINGTSKLCDIVMPLLTWYDENARALPWRENTDPYRVWVSEIMLQQTRVETVIPYYLRFMKQIPNIKSLAEAEEGQLLKLWEGLGYYSRALNLQKAARTIMAKYGGQFPEVYSNILSLPGIGKYTAGAIASICFEQPVAAVDGNVLRVVARLTGCDADISAAEVKDKIADVLSQIYPTTRNGDFTQSLMELGATVCLPKDSVKCSVCPVAFLCQAYRTGTQAALPVKAKKMPRKKERKTVFLLCCADKIAVRRRETDALLRRLWEFPNIAENLTPEQARNVLVQWEISVVEMTEGIRKKHIFTHVEWEMTSYVVVCENMPSEFLWVTKKKLIEDLALPSAFQAFVACLEED